MRVVEILESGYRFAASTRKTNDPEQRSSGVIPYLNLAAQYHSIKPEDRQLAIAGVLEKVASSSWAVK